MKAIKSHIKRNLNKPNFFGVNVTTVSASGMTRRMKVYCVYKGEIINITHLVEEATGWVRNSDGVKVSGCGMDMIWHMLDAYASTFYKTKLKRNSTNALKAVNHYRML